jgi:hypothetical protein
VNKITASKNIKNIRTILSLTFLMLASAGGSNAQSQQPSTPLTISPDRVTILTNPDGTMALYRGDQRIGVARDFEIDSNLVKPTGSTPPAGPTPAPTGSTLSAEIPPKPSPTPAPVKFNPPPTTPTPAPCHGPFCPGGTNFDIGSGANLYRTNENVPFPSILTQSEPNLTQPGHYLTGAN